MRQRHRHIRALVLICNFLLHHLTLASPVFGPQFLTGGTGRNIRHLPCVSRRTGETGICMFAFTCAKANGTHLGTCIDRFYFGSCCKIDGEPDIFPQDNTIDVDNSLSVPKPFSTTTAAHVVDSNDIPGNVDKPKPSTRPTSNAATLSVSTKTTESTTSKSPDQMKTKPVKIATNIETTTESIRLSTFQTVQNASDQRPTTTPSITVVAVTSKRPQRPSISNLKPITSQPKPTSTSTSYSAISNNAVVNSTYPSISTATSFGSSYKPSLSSFGSSSIANNHIIASKKPYPTTGLTKRPVFAYGSTLKPELPGVTRPALHTTTNHNATIHYSTAVTHNISSPEDSRPTKTSNLSFTQKISSVTRFPPRNTTIGTPTFATQTNTQPTTITSITITEKDIEETLKPLITRKPVTTKKPPKGTTKRPIISKKPSQSTISRRPVLTTSTAFTTPSSTKYSILNSTHTPSKTTTPSTTTTITTTGTSITNINKKPLTTIPTKRPTVIKRPLTASTIRPSTTAKRPAIISTTRRPIFTTSRRNITTSSVSSRPITTIPNKLPSATKPAITTFVSSSKLTTQSNTDTIITKPTTIKITRSTTTTPKTTLKPFKQTVSTVATMTPLITLKVTTPTTIKTTSSSITKETNTKPATQSYTNSTTQTSLANPKNVTTPSLNISMGTTVSNEIDSDFTNATEQTTVVSGIITWTSFADEVESTTKNPEHASSTPETVVTEWTPITTPNGWIVIQSPSTDKFDSEVYLDANPTALTTQVPVTVKPSIDSSTTKRTTISTTTTTTTQRSTSQSTTYIDMLSTVATVTVAPEFTEPPFKPLNMSDFRQVCGRRIFPEARIVGGDGSTFGKWPWQISLRQWRTSTYLHKCGAALLNENWAITAAHCVQNVLPSDLLLRIGEHDLGNEEEPYGFQERRVQIVASHPNFDPRTFEFDLALMRFYEPVLPFQPNVLPICVPDDDEDFVGQTAFVTGWGRLYEDGPLPSVLQEVAVPVINNSVCEGMYRSAGYIEHIPHIFICAGWRKGGFDSCEGDSGGPLVIQRKRDRRWVLAGVISWGIGCAEPNQPGVYTRISEFREWINQILQF